MSEKLRPIEYPDYALRFGKSKEGNPIDKSGRVPHPIDTERLSSKGSSDALKGIDAALFHATARIHQPESPNRGSILDPKELPHLTTALVNGAAQIARKGASRMMNIFTRTIR